MNSSARFVRLNSAWFRIGHQRRPVFLYSQHWARPKKNSAINAAFGGGFDGMWRGAVLSASYLGFLSGELSREEMAEEFVREAGADFAAELGRAPEAGRTRAFAALERMAMADGEFSAVERLCISALLERSRTNLSF